MARLMFGGGITDWTFVITADDFAQVRGGVTLTFYDQETGGTRYDDLQTLSGSPMTQVVTSGGLDGRTKGQIPAFLGPNGVFEMWADGNGGSGPRVLMSAANIGSELGPVASQLAAHIAPNNVNPHGTTLASLTDVSALSSATTGQLIGKDAGGKWVPVTVPGVGGTVTLAGAQTITGAKTFDTGDTATTRIVVQAAETGQTADILAAFSGVDTGQGGARQRVFYLNNEGAARAVAPRSSSPAFRARAQTGQTANIVEVCDSSNNPIAVFTANGSLRAPNIVNSIMLSKAGAVVVGAGTFTWYNDAGVPLTIRSVRASVGTAPTGATLMVDVNLNGATIYTTSANRPTIPIGAKTSGKNTGMGTTTIPDGGAITVDVDQVGSTVAGADLVVQIDVY